MKSTSKSQLKSNLQPPSTSRFPWRLYGSLVLRQWIASLLIIGSILAGLFFYTRTSIRPFPDLVPFIQDLFWVLFWFLAFAFLIFFLVTGRNQITPLARLVNRARKIAQGASSGDSARELDDVESLLENEPAEEWGEIESTLNQLQAGIEANESQHAQDQTEIQAILSAVSEAIIAVNLDHHVLFSNKRFHTLFGASSNSGQITDYIRNPEILDTLMSVLIGTEERRLTFHAFIQGSEKKREFLLHATPLRRLDTQEVYGVVGVFYDVSELRKVERMRIEFVANVSHELRTPLTSIKGFTDTLLLDLQQKQFADLESYAQKIQSNTTRLINLTHDLLDLSALDAGIELQLSEVSVSSMTQKVLAQLEGKRQSKSILIESKYGVDQVWADPLRLEQVLVNLIDNAIKYTQPGGKVSVIWERPGTLRVMDNGPGISVEHQDRLFERFYRVDKARSSSMGGTGLGLAIVKHILIQHKGKVGVKSQLGKGTEFICEFPKP